jgi:hypothetical protein
MSIPAIRIEEDGYTWLVPLAHVAAHRAKYYAAKDPDTTYQAEYDFVMKDDYEGVDWFQNNMNLSDLPEPPLLHAAPARRTGPAMDGDYEIEIIGQEG